MSIPRTSLPWLDWDEWITVKNALYPSVDTSSSSSSSSSESSRNSIIWALEIVNLWRARGKLPHSCDSTAQLMEISNTDANSHINSSSYRSENELRMTYSLAVVRAINGLVDHNQQGAFADSVLGLASRIGIPGWIVELRHEATHVKLPTLSLLKAAARHLIAWYYDNYWNPQLLHIQAMTLSCIQLQPSSLSLSLANNGISDTTSSSSPTFLTEILIPSFIDAEITNKTYKKKEDIKAKLLKLNTYVNSNSDNGATTNNIYELLLIRLYSATTYHNIANIYSDDESNRFLLICSYMEEIIILINDNKANNNDNSIDRLKNYISYLKTLCSYISVIRERNNEADTIIDNFIETKINNKKRHTELPSTLSKSSKRNRWRKVCDNDDIWPIGVVPGTFSPSLLLQLSDHNT